MRVETFQAIQREISRDPLTERQRDELAGQDSNRLLNTSEAAEMLGISPETLRRKANRHLLPKVKTNGRSVLFRFADVVDFRNKNTI
jgi:excisionase family DNA binding protein